MRTIIIERWAILRLGLRAVLGHSDHAVLNTASTAEDGLNAVAGARDLQMVILGTTDDRDMVDLTVQVVASAPGTRVLVLADGLDRPRIDGLLGVGAMGILGRLAEGDEVLEAIDRIARGERVLSNEVINTLVGAIEAPGASLEGVSVPTVLTTREREILSWLSTGSSNRDIARRLYIGEATVKSHLASAYSKLGVTNRQIGRASCRERVCQYV